MSFVPWKLVSLIGLIPAVGAGIAYPIVNSLNSREQNILLNNLNDFRRHCGISIIGGDQSKPSETNRKILVCPVNNNSTGTIFYFYNETPTNLNQLPKKVKRLIVDNSELRDIKLVFVDNSDSQTEIISVDNTHWKFLYNIDLLEQCKVTWQEKGENRRLSCGTIHSRELSQFQ